MGWILEIDLAGRDADELTDALWTHGTTGVAEVSDQLIAGFDTEAEAMAASEQVGGEVRPVDPSQWKTPETTTVSIGDRSLTIDAGHSFGHGGHPTTALCLRALERHVQPGDRVLDLGCGSGVLALTAAVLGAVEVHAVDIDPAAVQATIANAAANQVKLAVSDTPLTDLDGPFDLTVVNMLVAELEPLAAELIRVSTDRVVLSGALIEQSGRWDAMLPGWTIVEETTEGEWACRVCVRSGGW